MPFLLMVAVSAALIAIEWGFMTAPAAGIREPRADVEWVRGSLEHWGAV